MSLDDLGDEYKSYWWGLKYNNKLITVEIPDDDSDNRVIIGLKDKYLLSIPSDLCVFYEYMDGMAIADGIGPTGYDLPSSLSDWHELRGYFEDEDLSPYIANRMYKDLPNSDLRVFIKCSDGRLVVCNLSGSARQLYFICDDYKSYTIIKNPIETLDVLFVNAIQNENTKNKMGR